MSDEDLNANPLFVAFLESTWFKQAAQQALIIAVPAKQALTSIKISNEVIENHVLKQSPYYQDEYVTVNGKSVSYNASQLICKPAGSWSGERIVDIQAQELYYDDVFESFSVLRVTLPLDGKVSDDYMISLEASNGVDPSRPERRSLSQHEQLLVRLTGDAIKDQNSIFASIHKFVLQFNTSYVLVKGFIEHAGNKVRDACARLSEEANVKVRVHQRDLILARSSLTYEVHWAIESIVMHHIHKKLFTGLCELYRNEEESLQSLIIPLRQASQQALGVRDDIVCQPTVAIALLADLGSFHTPLRKLAQLENVSRALTQAVRQASQRSSVKDNVLSAEDIIPLTLYTLIQSGLPHVYAHLQYLIHFAPNPMIGSLDHISVHFANFHAAVQLIQSGALLQAVVSPVANGDITSRNQHQNNVSDHVPRARMTKVSSHQRTLSSLSSGQSVSANAPNHSAYLHALQPAIARVPNRSPTRSFSVIHDEEFAATRTRVPSVSRTVSTPLATASPKPNIASPKHTSTPTVRASRRTQPLPTNHVNNDENQQLGEFLLNLKNDTNVVVGSFSEQGTRW